MNAKQEAILIDLYMQPFANKLENPRMQKAQSLWTLAKAAPLAGCIVELGTFQGCGALALGWGAKKGQMVYTFDDYAERTGWAGEKYGAGDKEIFEKALLAAKLRNVMQIEKPIEFAVKDWDQPITLCYWDLWGARMITDFAAWSKHVIPGGVFAIHEPGKHGFGGDNLIKAAVGSGLWEFGEDMPGYIYTLIKKG